jgi:hypothetical protein
VGGSFFIHYPPPSATLKNRDSVENARFRWIRRRHEQRLLNFFLYELIITWELLALTRVSCAQHSDF